MSLELMGIGVVSWTNEVRRSVNVHVNTCSIHLMLIHVCVHVCVAQPMVVGAWSMVGALRQLFEYYYYYCNCDFELKLYS